MIDTQLLHEPNQQTSSPGAAPLTEPPANGNEFSLLDLLIIVAERKSIILKTTAVFAVLAIVIAFLLPKRYTATVILLPPEQNNSMGAMLASQLGNLGGMASLASGSLGLKNPNDKYVGLLKSRTVEDAMVQHFGLMHEYHDHYLSIARKDFENHVTIDGNGKDGLIHISVEDHNPQRAAEIANGYVKQFRDLSQNLAITEASQRRLFFQQELEKAKDKLADSEEALKETEQKTGFIQPESQARALIESAAELRGEIAEKEVELQGMETYATGQNSQLIETQQELDSLRSQLAKLGGSEDSSGGLLIPKGLVPEASLEYIRKYRDVKYYETIFEILAKQFELAKLDEAKEGALIQVVDPAIPPDRKSYPKRAFIIVCGTIAGFLIGVFYVLVQAGIGRMEDDPDASEKIALLKRALSLRKPSPS